MSALTEFRNSDSLLFTNGIAYHGEAPIVGQFDGRTSQPFCIDKTSPLAITINARTFWPDLDCDLNLRFTGTPIENADGSATITWNGTPVEDLRTIRCFGIFVPSTISARFTTTIASLAPTIGINCNDMMERVFRTSMALTGSENRITITGNIGTITIDLLEANANCGSRISPVFFNLSMRASNRVSDGCGHQYHLIDSLVRFSATIEDEHTEGSVTATNFQWSYQWQGDAGFTDLPSGSNTTSLQLNRSGTINVKVVVVLTTDFQTGTGFETGTRELIVPWEVVTEEESNQRKMMCRLRQGLRRESAVVVRGVGKGFTVGSIRFVDPLWDPTPDQLRVEHLSLPQLNRLQAELQDTIALAGKVLKLTNSLVEKGQKEFELKAKKIAPLQPNLKMKNVKEKLIK